MNENTLPAPLPLCVDMDGTLVKGDLLDEQLVVLIKRNPLALVYLLFALLRGKAAFKSELARRASDGIDVETLPYDESVLDLIRARKFAGAKVELVSGSHITVVRQVADHVGLFDAAFGSDEACNLTRDEKALFLQRHHPDGFSYIGDSKADLPVWRAAEEALIAQAPAVGPSPAKDLGDSKVVSTRSVRRLNGFIRAMRVHQWIKNGLIFLPLILTLSGETQAWHVINCVIGFFAFCLLSSGSYFINDILDVQADRRHPTKKARAMAAGIIPLRVGGALGLTVMAAGFFLGAMVSSAFVAVLAAYTALTLCYSLLLKRLIAIDVLVISILFLIRAYSGAIAIDQQITVWLAAFLLFFFLALAIAKRVIELKRVGNSGAAAERGANGRAYIAEDSMAMMAAGVTFSIASILLFLIYGILEQHSLYRDSWAIVLTAALLAYWTLRFWLLVHRDHVDMDPVAFVIQDSASFLTLAAIVGVAVTEQLPRFLG